MPPHLSLVSTVKKPSVKFLVAGSSSSIEAFLRSDLPKVFEFIRCENTFDALNAYKDEVREILIFVGSTKNDAGAHIDDSIADFARNSLIDNVIGGKVTIIKCSTRDTSRAFVAFQQELETHVPRRARRTYDSIHEFRRRLSA